MRAAKTDATKATRAKELRQQMTPAEALLWAELRGSKLKGLHFRRQQVIGSFIVDFYCDAAALAVELDGEVHRTQQEYDRERDAVLEGRRIRLLRLENGDVDRDMGLVLERIAGAASLGAPGMGT